MRSKIYTLLCGVMLLSLSACAALTGPQASVKGLISACNGYASTLTTLAVANMNGQLSKGQVDTINQVNAIVKPLCTAPSMDQNQAQAISEVQSAMIKLATVQTQIKGN